MLELEHTLIMLLLLVNLLSARPGVHAYLRWLVVGVILLAFIVPSIPLALPWGVFAALFIPILLWQSAQRLGSAGWFGSRRDFFMWLALTLGIAGVIFFTGGLPITSAMLFGLLAASIAWNTLNPEKKETILGLVGVLTLVFLLAGIEAAVEAPGQFMLALLAGGAVGAAVGYLSVLAASRIQPGLPRDLFSLAPGYLAYAVGSLIGMSAVAAAVLSIAVYVGYGTRRGLWADGRIGPRPFENNAVYALAVAALAFFGWQTHVPFSLIVLLEVLLAVLLTGIVFWLGKRSGLPETGAQYSLPEVLLRVGLLLAAALLLWPKSMLVDPLPLLIALGFAALTAVSASVILAPMIELFSWLEEAQAAAAEPAVPSPKVKEFMRSDYPLIAGETPVEQIPGLFAAHGSGGVLVAAEGGGLAGIITEADLFVKEQKVPRTDVTYLALFQHPVQPEYIMETYASARGQYCAADIMSRTVISIGQDEPIGRALQIMVKYGYKIIPVVENDSPTNPRVVGVLARADLIQKFMAPVE